MRFDNAWPSKLTNLVTTTLREWHRLPTDAIEALDKFASPEVPLTELGLIESESWTEAQLKILPMVKFIAKAGNRSVIAKATKIMQNLEDVQFVLQWVQLVSHIRSYAAVHD